VADELAHSCSIFRLDLLRVLGRVIWLVGIAKEELSKGKHKRCWDLPLFIRQRLVSDESGFAANRPRSILRATRDQIVNQSLTRS